MTLEYDVKDLVVDIEGLADKATKANRALMVEPIIGEGEAYPFKSVGLSESGALVLKYGFESDEYELRLEPDMDDAEIEGDSVMLFADGEIGRMYMTR